MGCLSRERANQYNFFYGREATNMLKSELGVPFEYCSPEIPSIPFTFTVKTDNAGISSSTQFTLPFISSGTYSCLVDYGDGIEAFITAYNQAEVTHTYASPGTYEIKIYGTCIGFRFNNGGDRLKMLNISQWGPVAFLGGSAFYGCTNLTCSATDAPDLSAATSVQDFFRTCTNFNGDMSAWDVSTITNFQGCFRSAPSFIGTGVGGWDMSSATSIQEMFHGCSAFNQDLNSWDVSNVTNMVNVFLMLNEAGSALVSSVFNGNVTSWDVSSVTNMSGIFFGCTAFNQDIGGWDVSSVTTMQNMFRNCTIFNQDLNTWDVSSVTNMQHMFASMGAFNGNIGGWDVSGVTNMSFMFINNTAINQTLNSWDVSSVTTIQEMFRDATAFNGNITSWTTSSLVIASGVFRGATDFNQDIGGWDMSNVTTMASMFLNATSFNQDIGGWNIDSLTNATSMFNGVTLSSTNYDALLNGWVTNISINNGVSFDAGNSQYTAAASAARATFIGTYSWTITDGGMI